MRGCPCGASACPRRCRRCGCRRCLSAAPSAKHNPPLNPPLTPSPPTRTRAANTNTERKLLLVVRHGQAVSNYLSDTLGPDEWFAVEGTCDYTDKDGKHWDIFDAGARS